MPVTQIMSVAGRVTGPSPVGSLIWNGVTESYLRPTGGINPALTSMLMPDSVTTKQVHVFNGTDYIVTPGHSLSNVYFNIWFYPTANNVVLVSHLDSIYEASGYHYSMLEINSTSKVDAGAWNGGNITTVTTTESVNLNAWNHIYYYCAGGTLSLSLNNSAAYTTSLSYSPPGTSYFTFGAVESTYISTSNRFQGKLADVVGSSSALSSNYNDTKTVYGLT